MSAKQNESKQPGYRVDSLVDTIWNEYESEISRLRQRAEQREDVYLSFVEESRKTFPRIRDKFGRNL